MEVRVVQETEAELRRLTEPILAGEGLELVDFALKGSPGRQVLRLDIDRPGVRGVDLADCQRVSRALGEVLDEAEPISGGYLLEVSSPGIDRPIRSADDIRRNTGRRVLVVARDADGASREHRGTLLGSEEGHIRLQEAEGQNEVRIPLDSVLGARQDVDF
jgi:ribosome maturation factor RimP